MEPTQENQLVESCKAGDAQAYAQLYDAYFEKLYRFVYYRTQHKQTAEDIVAQTFLQAWQKIGTYNSSKAGFSTWLYQIARNLLIDYYRKAVPLQGIESAWDIGEDAGLETDAETALFMSKIKPYFSELSPRQKQVLTMRIWEDLSYKEIAQILDTTEAACKMSFSRTISELKGKMVLVILLLQIIKFHN